MPLIACPQCMEKIADDLNECPFCHAKVKSGNSCPACRGRISNNPANCPHCNEPLRFAPAPTLLVQPAKTSNGRYVVNLAIVGVFGVVVIFWILSVIDRGVSTAPVVVFTPRPTSALPVAMTVEYVVLCDGCRLASITYQAGEGEREQRNNVSLPWRFTREDVASRDFLYVQAQIDDGNGEITCEILVDGEIYRTASSNGEYVIATCSGSAP